MCKMFKINVPQNENVHHRILLIGTSIAYTYAKLKLIYFCQN